MKHGRVHYWNGTGRQKSVRHDWLYHITRPRNEMTNVKLDAWAFITYFTDRVISGIRKALPVLLEELKRLTPEDTKEMLNSYVVNDPVVVDWVVKWVIENTSWHAIFVEYWVGWLKFNYHKPKGSVFYSWVGNRTFARAVDNVRKKVIEIILAEINR